MSHADDDLRAFTNIQAVQVGDYVKFYPDSNERQWWHVVARNDDHVVAVRQAPFQEKGTLQYTVTGYREYQYNGVGPGLVRSSLDSMGGGWDLGEDGSEAYTIIEALESGDHDLSNRRLENVKAIEVKRD